MFHDRNLGLIIDVARCHDCNNCFLACKDEFVGNAWPPYSKAQPDHGQRWMNILRRERGGYPLVEVAYLPKPCQHCKNPLCLKAARNGAVTIRDDGIVLIDPDKATGQKQLVEACPYGAIFWNEASQTPKNAACAAICWMRAGKRHAVFRLAQPEPCGPSNCKAMRGNNESKRSGWPRIYPNMNASHGCFTRI